MQPPDDDQFSELLALCHEAVLEGTNPSVKERLIVDSTHPLSARLQRGAQCLQLLEECRRFEHSSPDTPLGDPVPSSQLPIGSSNGQPLTRLGRFRIEAQLGQGGHGIVYRAYDDALQRMVALKIPRMECLISQEMRLRFLREGQVAAQLAHPNLLTIYESGVDGALFYLALAYCSGPTLAEWLRKRSVPVSEQLAVRIVSSLADGVAYAHDRGILHRDIKPSNIFLDYSAHGFIEEFRAETGERTEYIPRLGDFGLARFTEEANNVTRSGAMVGTPAYMAPEQAHGWHDQIGPATDVYGLGSVLFELLTGRPPFQGSSDVDVLRRVVADDCVNPRTFRRNLSPDLSAICARCLQKKPSERYQTAAELVADLDRFARGVPTLARPMTVPERLWKWICRRPAMAASLTVSLLAMISLMVVTFMYARQTSRMLSDSESQRTALEASIAARNRSESQARHSGYALDMRLAFQNWMGGDAKTTEEILQRYNSADGPADIRDFAWWMLKRMTEESTVIARHEGGVTAAAVSPDGRMFATVGKDRIIHLWDTIDRGLQAKLSGHATGSINALAFSPDGRQLVSAADDWEIRRWSVENGQPLSSLQGSSGWNADVEFSLDGRLIASCGEDRFVRIWSADTGAPVGVLEGHKDIVRTIVFAASHLYSASQDGEVRCWDLTALESSGQAECTLLDNPGNSYVMELAIESPPLNCIVGALWSGGYLSWDRDHPEQPCVQLHRETSPRSIACSSNYMVALGMSDGSIQFSRSEEAGQFLFRLRPVHADRVMKVAFVPGTDQLLTASRDGTVRLLPVPTVIHLEHTMWRSAQSLRWRENLLTSVCAYSSLYVFDTHQRRLKCWLGAEIMDGAREADSASRLECSVLLSPDTLKVVRWPEGEMVWSVESVDRSHFAIDPQDMFVAITNRDDVVLHDLATGQIAARFPHPTEVHCLAFCSQSGSLITAAQDRRIRIWDVESKTVVEEHTLDGIGSPKNIAVSANGEFIAVLCNGLHLWNRVSNSRHSFSLRAAPKAIALVGSGNVLACLEPTGLRFYRIADGAELLDLRGHVPVEQMAVSPDGSTLALQKDMFLDFLDGRPHSKMAP